MIAPETTSDNWELNAWVKGLILGLLAALIAAWRIPVIYEALERDVMLWAVMAKRMLEGGGIFTDFWDQRPPGIHTSYAAAFLVFGYNQFALYAVSVFYAWVGLAGAYFSGKKLGTSNTGLLAALFWALICGDGLLFANQAKCEVMVNACVLCGFAALAGRVDSFSLRRALLAGLSLTLAVFWFKFSAVTIAGALLLAHVFGAGQRRKTALCESLIAVGCMVIFFAAFLAYFKVLGRFDEMWTWLVEFNSASSQGGWNENLVEGLRPSVLIPPYLRFTLPLFGLSLVAIVLCAIRGRYRDAIFLLAWAVGAFAAVVLPGRFQPDYYQLWFPFLAVGGAAGVSGMLREPARAARGIGTVVALACIAILLRHDAFWVGLSSKEWGQRQYGPQAAVFEQARDFGNDVNGLLKPDETFFMWGIDPGVYFSSRRLPPTNWLTNIFDQTDISNAALKQRMIQKTLEQLNAAPPELIVVQLYATPPGRWSSEAILGWVRQNYVLVPGQTSPDYRSFMKRGGALGARMLNQPSVPGFEGLRSVGLDQHENGGITPELSKGTVLEEDVVCERSNLRAVEVMVATFARKNAGTLVIDVIDDQKQTIGRLSADMKAIADNSYVQVPVLPKGDSANRPLTIRLSSPDAETGHAVMAWSSKTKVYPSGTFRVNDKVIPADLTFRLIHADLQMTFIAPDEVYDVDQQVHDSFTLELTKGQTIDQGFVPTQPGMIAVEIFMGTFARQNKGKVIFTVLDEEQQLVGELSTDMSALKDNAYVRVPMLKPEDAPNKHYSFHVESPDGAPNNAVMVWASKTDVYSGGELRMNGSPRTMDATFRLIHRASERRK